MEISVGDYITRNSYHNDTVFIVINIIDDILYLKGVDVRLYADCTKSDAVKCDYHNNDTEFDVNDNSNRSDYFYLPAKILHIDGDADYLERCLAFYHKNNLKAIGKKILEEEIPLKIEYLLKKFNPDIVIITGHDAYYDIKDNKHTISYKNSDNFIKAVKNARKYEKSHEKLVIIAGACQSNYEELIKAGANFASSPKRINIHALDPAIIASSIALTETTKKIDVPALISKTKYGKDGIGGLITYGLMYVGYPR